MDAQELKEMRCKLKLSQEEFARLIGVSFGTINRWERGAFKPSKLALEKIRLLKDKE